MAPLSTETGTNATVASGAFFGIRGRYLGSAIVQIVDLGYFALALVLAVPAIDEALSRLFGAGRSSAIPTMAVTAACTIVLGIFGHRTLIAAQKLNSLAGLASVGALAVFASLHLASPHPPVTHPAPSPGPVSAILLATAVQFANAISYAPYVGDQARYIHPRAGPGASKAAFAGMLAGSLSILAGLLIGSAVPDPGQTVREMVDLLPVPLVVPVVLAGILGNVTSGGTILYNGMLDLHAILWRWTRLQAGILFAALGVTASFLSLVLFDLVRSLETLCTIVGVLVAPWIAIAIVGRLLGPRLDAPSLQDFALTDPANPYRDRAGINRAGIAAWAAGAATGLVVHQTARLDLGIPAAMLVAVFAWLALQGAKPAR